MTIKKTPKANRRDSAEGDQDSTANQLPARRLSEMDVEELLAVDWVRDEVFMTTEAEEAWEKRQWDAIQRQAQGGSLDTTWTSHNNRDKN